MTPIDPERVQQIEVLYHATRERGPAERDGDLAACRGDAELLRAVAALLAQESSGGPLERPIWDAAAVLLSDLRN